MRVSKFPKLRLLQLWKPITLCVDLRLRWGLKQSCSLRWEFSICMWHTTCTQGGQGGSWLLVVRIQIGNLTPDPSLGHNLCFNYPNGSCKPNLDIYVQKAFQWYNELFNPMGYDPCNCFLKIRESIGTLTPKVGTHLGVWRFIPSHSPTFPHSHTPKSMKCDSRVSFLAYTFTSPCFGCEPKARVATYSFEIVQWVSWRIGFLE